MTIRTLSHIIFIKRSTFVLLLCLMTYFPRYARPTCNKNHKKTVRSFWITLYIPINIAHPNATYHSLAELQTTLWRYILVHRIASCAQSITAGIVTSRGATVMRTSSLFANSNRHFALIYVKRGRLWHFPSRGNPTAHTCISRVRKSSIQFFFHPEKKNRQNTYKRNMRRDGGQMVVS